MNTVILCGRLVRDPEARTLQTQKGDLARVTFTLAVDRKFKNAEQNADFIGCVAFGKVADFCTRYLQKGTKINVRGHIQTGSYTDRDNKRVYTTDVVVEEVEFCERKTDSTNTNNAEYSGSNRRPEKAQGAAGNAGFMNVPDGVEDEGLPFN